MTCVSSVESVSKPVLWKVLFSSNYPLVHLKQRMSPTSLEYRMGLKQLHKADIIEKEDVKWPKN